MKKIREAELVPLHADWQKFFPKASEARLVLLLTHRLKNLEKSQYVHDAKYVR